MRHALARLPLSDAIGSIGNRHYRKLNLVAAAGVLANGNWLYYNSEVYAPVELYQPGPAAIRVGLEYNRQMSTVVRNANAAAGYERWQVVNP